MDLFDVGGAAGLHSFYGNVIGEGSSTVTRTTRERCDAVRGNACISPREAQIDYRLFIFL